MCRMMIIWGVALCNLIVVKQGGVQSVFSPSLSKSSVNKGLTRFMCTVCSTSPFVNVTVKGPCVSLTNQGPVQRGSSLFAQGLFKRTC